MRKFTITLIMTVFIVLPAAGLASTGDEFTQVFGFQLDETKLKAVQQSLGYVDLIQTGDASEATASLCYFLLNENVTVKFISDEMRGGKILNEVAVQEGRASDENCGYLLNKSFAPIDMGSLRIGMTLQDFQKLMGEARKLSGPPKTEYHFTYKKPKPDRETQSYLVLIQVIGTFSNDRLIELKIYKGLI